MKRSVGFALVLATALLGVRIISSTHEGEPPWDARPFDHPTNGVERALLLHDGQTYAALAQDPALQHPSLFYGDVDEEAYRAGRPVVPYLGWAGSLGRPGAVPIVLAVLTIVGVVALAGASASLAQALGRDASTAWVVLLLPGALASMVYIGLTDALATAGVLAAFVLWRRGQVGWATAVLAAAVLTRETSLIAVAALVITDRRNGRIALLAAAPYVAWLCVVRTRLGVWPFEASSGGARYTFPLRGLERGVGLWAPAAWLAFVIIVVVVALAWSRLPRDLRWFSGLWIAVASCMGWQVWARYFDFPRVLLPLTAVAVIALLPDDQRVIASHRVR